MKKYLLLALPLVLAACSSKPGKETATAENATFKGQLKNSKGDTLYLVNISQGQPDPIDTAVADAQGVFYFTRPVPGVGYYNLEINGQNLVTLILDSTERYEFTADAANLANTYEVKGSDENKRFKEFNEYAAAFHKKKTAMIDELKQIQSDYSMQAMAHQNDPAVMQQMEKEVEGKFNAIQEKAMKLDEEARAYLRKFITDKPASMANIPALYLTSEPQARQLLLDEYDNFNYFDTTAKALKQKYPNAPNVQLLAAQVEKIRPLASGALAPDITLNDPGGKPMSLSSLRGRVVLLDFWASWCAPCRSEMPNVVAAYKKYKSKGFEVFSVSLDADKSRWVEAIRSDGMTWPYHVSDLRQWQSSVVPLYDIKGIPLTFLLDKDGKIIARGLRGIALEQKLKEIFGG